MALDFQKYGSQFLKLHPSIIAPHAFEGQGNGVISTEPLEAGTLLVSIPRDRLLSTNTIISHPILGKIIRKSLIDDLESPLTALEALCLGILFFRYSPSQSEFWTRYLETLPSQYESLIFWPSDALKLLGSRETVKQVEKRNTKIMALFEHTKAMYEKHMDAKNDLESKFLPHLTIEAFRWAYATVMSRSVFVSAASLWSSDFALQKDNAALPPLLDFFNHSNETECDAGYSTATQCYELRTKQNWAANSQIFIKYGCHSNYTLLMHYGFAIADNVYDSIPLRIDFHELIGQTAHAEAKFTKLYAYGLIDPPSRINTSKSVKHVLSMDGMTWNTMVALKTMLLKTEEEISNWDRLLEDAAVSEANERDYAEYCRSMYESMLWNLDDAEEEGPNTPNMENKTWHLLANTFRRGWRSILLHAMVALETC
jgi:hypothetical protein